MVDRIRAWLAPPRFADDELSRRAAVLNATLLTLIALLSLMLVGAFVGGRTPPGVVAASVVSLVAVLGLRGVMLAGRLDAAGVAVIVLGIAASAVAGVSLGTVRAPAMSVLVVVVVTAGLLFDWRAMLATATASSLVIGALIIAEIQQWLPPPDPALTVTQWTTFAGVFFWVGTLTVISQRTTHRALEERRRLERELQQERDFALTVLNEMTQGVAVMDRATRFEFVNAGITRALGYSRDELLALRSSELVYPPDRERLAQARRQRDGRQSSEYEVRYTHRDGHPVPLLVSGVPRVVDGAVIGAIVVVTDLTERKRVEAELTAQRDFAQTIMNTMGQGLTVTGADLRFEYVNPAYAGLLGYTPDEMVGHSPLDYVVRDDADALGDAARDRRAGKVTAYESRYRRRDGGIVTALVTGVPRIVDGQYAGSIAVVTDLTERKRLEVELQRERDFAQTIMNTMGQGLAVIDAADEYQYVNPAFARLLGYTPGDFAGRRPFDFIMPDDLPLVRKAVLDRRAGKVTSYEMRFRHRHGHAVPMLVTGVPRWDGGAFAGVVAVFADLTDIKRAEREVQRQLERARALGEIDAAIIGSAGLSTVFRMVLDHVLGLLGADAATVSLLDPAGQVLNLAASRGFRTAQVEDASLRLGQGVAGRAALEQRVMQYPDADSPQVFHYSGLWQAEGFIKFYALPLVARGQVRGTLEVYFRKPYAPESEWLDFLQALAGQTAIAIDNSQLYARLQDANAELLAAYDETIEGWSRALDMRDHETEGHTRRVTELTLKLARAAGMSAEELVHVRRGALMHDIGKMGVPDSVLLKPGPLTAEEMAQMRQHPVLAHEWLWPIPYFRPSLDIPYCHHEKWDGTGYPRGLQGEQIPLSARLFAVVDVWDALRSDRPYRKAWERERVCAHIEALAGTHFDPQAVRLFMRIMADE